MVGSAGGGYGGARMKREGWEELEKGRRDCTLG